MISKRLRVLSTLVPNGTIACDIGTDHAYLPCELIRRGICSKVYACDIAEGPLKQAQKTILEAGYSQQISTILCPGFSKVPLDANSMIIAGMGWKTIEMILEDDFERLTQFQRIILQSNRDVCMLRRWVSEHHMTIEEEKVVEDAGKTYEIVCLNTSFHESYTELEIKYGPVLLKRKDSEFLEYLDRRIAKNEVIASKVTDDTKKAQLYREAEEMKQIRQQYVKLQ